MRPALLRTHNRAAELVGRGQNPGRCHRTPITAHPARRDTRPSLPQPCLAAAARSPQPAARSPSLCHPRCVLWSGRFTTAQEAQAPRPAPPVPRSFYTLASRARHIPTWPAPAPLTTQTWLPSAPCPEPRKGSPHLSETRSSHPSDQALRDAAAAAGRPCRCHHASRTPPGASARAAPSRGRDSVEASAHASPPRRLSRPPRCRCAVDAPLSTGRSSSPPWLRVRE